jgi:hypothetical protein
MFTRLLRRVRYGDPVVVVSGLPRSGTSMLMGMLTAGGLPALTDSVRGADEDNPRGYFEFEPVKALAEGGNKAWVRQARGRALKVISHLLKELPADNYYQVIFAVRDLHEIVASQNLMLRRRNEPNPVDDARAVELFGRHIVNVRVLTRMRPNMEMLAVNYSATIGEPAATARRINAFIGGRLDEAAMAAVVDARLYRNRAAGRPAAVA